MRGLLVALLTGCSAAPSPAPQPAPVELHVSPDAANAPTCEAVIASLTARSRQGAESAVGDDDDRAYLEDFLAKQAARLAAECTSRPWSAAYRTCIAEADTDSDLRACDRDDRLARGVDLGGASCEEIGRHFAQIIGAEPPPPPHAQVPSTPQQIERNAEALAMICENVPWTRTIKACMLKATTGDELKACQH